MTAANASDGPRLSHVQCLGARGLHRMAWWEWGDPANPRVLICVHGLSRQGRDFDTLARAMHDEFRVVCPDVVGRGESDRLADPSGYQLPNYVADMVTLMARLNADSVAWFGTSMGGLIGIGLASLPATPIGRLVINDIGPAIDAAGIVRIGGYLGAPLTWGSVDEAADYLLTISQGRPAFARGMARPDPADAAPARRAVPPSLRPGDRRADARGHARDRRGRAGRALGPRSTRSAVRRCCCAVPSRTCSRAPPPKR